MLVVSVRAADAGPVVEQAAGGAFGHSTVSRKIAVAVRDSAASRIINLAEPVMIALVVPTDTAAQISNSASQLSMVNG
jgi:hypothetical protein